MTADEVTVWLAALPSTGHFVYHLCAPIPGVDPEDDLQSVYIGVTSNLRGRMKAHARKWWWAAIDPELGELLECHDRGGAELLERELIYCYQPAMNRAGRLLLVR